MSKRSKQVMGVVFVVAVVIIGLLIYADLFGFEGPRNVEAVAPTLEAASQQVVYRIDGSQSTVTYTVSEKFAGKEVSQAVGTTQQIAGDILIDLDNTIQNQVGTIVINVEQFTSDSSLRDKRIRRNYLESSRYPEAVFVPRTLTDLPNEIVMGQPYTFTMVGDLTVKKITQPATWTITATLNGDVLTGSAQTTILMSTYDVGPIDIAGLVETADDVGLTLNFVAVAARDITGTFSKEDTSPTSSPKS